MHTNTAEAWRKGVTSGPSPELRLVRVIDKWPVRNLWRLWASILAQFLGKVLVVSGTGARYAAAVGTNMIFTVIVILVACFVPFVFVAITRGRFSARIPLEELTRRTRSVDVEAFCNLMDPDEESFLRSSLPAHLFRSVQRERLLAATEYVGAVSHNAAILLRIGEAARHDPDPEVVRAGQDLANNAVRLRLYCSLVLLRLWTNLLFPRAGLSSIPLAERYQHLSGLARRLGQLRHPSTVQPISPAG